MFGNGPKQSLLDYLAMRAIRIIGISQSHVLMEDIISSVFFSYFSLSTLEMLVYFAIYQRSRSKNEWKSSACIGDTFLRLHRFLALSCCDSSSFYLLFWISSSRLKVVHLFPLETRLRFSLDITSVLIFSNMLAFVSFVLRLLSMLRLNRTCMNHSKCSTITFLSIFVLMTDCILMLQSILFLMYAVMIIFIHITRFPMVWLFSPSEILEKPLSHRVLLFSFTFLFSYIYMYKLFSSLSCIFFFFFFFFFVLLSILLRRVLLIFLCVVLLRFSHGVRTLMYPGFVL